MFWRRRNAAWIIFSVNIIRKCCQLMHLASRKNVDHWAECSFYNVFHLFSTRKQEQKKTALLNFFYGYVETLTAQTWLWIFKWNHNLSLNKVLLLLNKQGSGCAPRSPESNHMTSDCDVVCNMTTIQEAFMLLNRQPLWDNGVKTWGKK